MVRLASLAFVAAAVFGLTVPPAWAQMPRKVGSCTQGTIKSIGTRFGERLVKPTANDMDQGAAFQASNGVYGISYQYDAALAASRIGDRVMTCLVSVPKGCPKGDDRGKVYTTTNMRTGASWTMPDAQHMCGGA